MSLEKLVCELESKLKVIEAKKKLAIEKGNMELFFAHDSVFSDVLFTLESLKLAIKNEPRARNAPPRTVQEIQLTEKELFEAEAKEWLRRSRGKGELSEFDYGLLRGKTIALQWVLMKEGVEI